MLLLLLLMTIRIALGHHIHVTLNAASARYGCTTVGLCMLLLHSRLIITINPQQIQWLSWVGPCFCSFLQRTPVESLWPEAWVSPAASWRPWVVRYTTGWILDVLSVAFNALFNVHNYCQGLVFAGCYYNSVLPHCPALYCLFAVLHNTHCYCYTLGK